MPRLSMKSDDSCRVHGRHAVYDLIDVHLRPLPIDEFEVPEHVREIVRRIPPWLRPMVQFLEGTLVRTWIGSQTSGEATGLCRAIVFGRAVLAHWIEDEPNRNRGCLTAILSFATLGIIAGIIGAGVAWVPPESAEPLLEKINEEFGKRSVEVTATAIVIATGLIVRKCVQLAKRVSCLEKHFRREGTRV